MERLYSDIAKEYILNTSYLLKVLVQLVDTEGPDSGTGVRVLAHWH